MKPSFSLEYERYHKIVIYSATTHAVVIGVLRVNSQHAFTGHQYHKCKKNTMGLLTESPAFIACECKDVDQPAQVNSQHAFIGHQYHKWEKNTMGLLTRKSRFYCM